MRHEIDTRTTTTGDQVTMYWYSRTGRICIEVESEDEAACRAFVAPHTAVDAFHHPYLYLQARLEPAAA
jgi:hypothetical protein